MTENEIGSIIVDTAMQLHKNLVLVITFAYLAPLRLSLRDKNPKLDFRAANL